MITYINNVFSSFNLKNYQIFSIVIPQVPESKLSSKCIIDTTRSSYLSYTPTSPSSSPSKQHHYNSNSSRGGGQEEGGVASSPLPPSLSSPGGAPTPSPSPDRYGGGGGGLHHHSSSGGGGSHSIRSPEHISSPNQRFEFLPLHSKKKYFKIPIKTVTIIFESRIAPLTNRTYVHSLRENASMRSRVNKNYNEP